MMYLSEAYILMMCEGGCALGVVIMNGKGALRNTIGLALAFVAYVILLGTGTYLNLSKILKVDLLFLET